MNITDELARLAVLRESGALTEGEFSDAKARLLGLESKAQRDELERLSALYARGALTAQEFESAKAALLSRGARPQPKADEPQKGERVHESSAQGPPQQPPPRDPPPRRDNRPTIFSKLPRQNVDRTWIVVSGVVLFVIAMGIVVSYSVRHADDVARASTRQAEERPSQSESENLKRATAEAPTNLQKAKQALSGGKFKEAMQFASKVPGEAKESNEAHSIRALAARSLGLKPNIPSGPPAPVVPSTSAAAREQRALLLWQKFKHEGFDTMVSAIGHNDDILEFRSSDFKYGDNRRMFFAGLKQIAGQLCAEGFTAVKLREDRMFGNEDTWDLGCARR